MFLNYRRIIFYSVVGFLLSFSYGCETAKPISGNLSSVVTEQDKTKITKNVNELINEAVNEVATDFLMKAPQFLPPSTAIHTLYRHDNTLRTLDNRLLKTITDSQIYTISMKGDYYFQSEIMKNKQKQFIWSIRLINIKNNKTLWNYQKNITTIY